MVKAPSSHGLDRKFKPWRRGKSQNSNRRSSLKQQLRGQERLLKRVEDEAHRQTLLQKIEELKKEIEEKQLSEKERQHAKQSHGNRFLERQKLVRMEHNARKEIDTNALDRIALDQIYVAHFPLYTRYMPLFRNGERRKDPPKVLTQRTRIRNQVLFEQLPSLSSTERKPWISSEQYNRVEAITRVISQWTLEEERRFFGEAEDLSKLASPTNDSRFTQSAKHEALLAAANEVEQELDMHVDDEELNTSLKEAASDDDSVSSDSDVNPLNPKSSRAKVSDTVVREKQDARFHKNVKLESENSKASPASTKLESIEFRTEESSDSGSVSVNSDESSTSSIGSSSSESLQDQMNGAAEVQIDHETNTFSQANSTEPTAIVDGDDDDFLVPIKNENDGQDNVFQNPSERMDPTDRVRGDKSQGWATQKQRPGQYKAQLKRSGQLKKPNHRPFRK